MTAEAARDLLREMRALRAERDSLREALAVERRQSDVMAQAAEALEKALADERAASDRTLDALNAELAAQKRRGAWQAGSGLLIGALIVVALN